MGLSIVNGRVATVTISPSGEPQYGIEIDAAGQIITLNDNRPVRRHGSPFAVGTPVELSDDGGELTLITPDIHKPLLVRITGNSAISGQSNRYAYSAAEVRVDTAGTSTDVSGGTTFTDTILNLAEVANTASGMQGNQFDLTNDTDNSSAAIRPIQTGRVCALMWHDDGTNVRPFIDVPNGVSDVCT